MAKKPTLVVVGEEERAAERPRRDDPDPNLPRGKNGDVAAGQWTPNRQGLPTEDPCPVICLGVEGGYYHLIDSAGQLRSVTKSDLNGAGLQDLFALYPNYPMWMAPHWKAAPDGKTYIVDNFEEKHVRRLIFQACARAGLFSPADKLRGRGAWTLRGGQIVYHSGEHIWVHDGTRFRDMDTGLLEGHLYPRLPSLPDPATDARPEEIDAQLRNLVETFRRWNWERPDIDPILLLGWIGVAYLGGALDWRSMIMLVGDKETGKSTLQKGIRAIFGDALFKSGDASAASIYQNMKQDARPIALDEFEADADPTRKQNIIKLMRVAASGDDVSRGGSNHEGIKFKMHSAFLFSAINNPVQASQDLSRVAVLRLRPLNTTQTAPEPIDQDLCGRMVLARLMQRWPEFHRLLADYKAVLLAGGHTGRGQDTYGTLLAAAELMLGPDLADALGVPMGDEARQWSSLLAADSLPEIEDAMQNWRKCLTYLMMTDVKQWRGGHRSSIGQCLDDVARNYASGEAGGYTLDEAKRDLAHTGLGLFGPGELPAHIVKAAMRAAKDNDDKAAARLDLLAEKFKLVDWALAIPNMSPKVAGLFEGSDWAGIPAGGGPWKDALRQAPDNIVITDKALNRVTVGGQQLRCSIVALRNFHEAPER